MNNQVTIINKFINKNLSKEELKKIFNQKLLKVILNLEKNLYEEK